MTACDTAIFYLFNQIAAVEPLVSEHPKLHARKRGYHEEVVANDRCQIGLTYNRSLTRGGRSGEFDYTVQFR